MKRPFGLALSLVLTPSVSYGGPASAVDWTTKVDASVLQAAALGDTQFIASMDAKADLSAASTFMAKVDKGRYVYQTLTETARTSQAALLTQLATLGASYRSYWITNAVHVSGGLSVLSAVASRAEVQAVFAVGKGRLDPPIVDAPGGTEVADVTTAVASGIARVRADQVWSLGYRGQGAVVANADTGVRWTHSALKGKYRGWGRRER